MLTAILHAGTLTLCSPVFAIVAQSGRNTGWQAGTRRDTSARTEGQDNYSRVLSYYELHYYDQHKRYIAREQVDQELPHLLQFFSRQRTKLPFQC